MGTLTFKKYPIYFLLCYLFLIGSLIIIFFNCECSYMINNWYNYLYPFLFFVAATSAGLFLYTKSQDSIILAITNSLSFAAILAYNASFSTIAMIIPMVISIFIMEKSRFENFVFLSLRISEIFIGGYIYYDLFKIAKDSTTIYAVLAAFAAGFVMLLIENLSSFLLTTSQKGSLANLKIHIRDNLLRSPLLWAWGIVFAHLVKYENYVLAAVQLVPATILYFFFVQQNHT